MGLETGGIIFMAIAYTCITCVLVYAFYKILSKPKN